MKFRRLSTFVQENGFLRLGAGHRYTPIKAAVILGRAPKRIVAWFLSGRRQTCTLVAAIVLALGGMSHAQYSVIYSFTGGDSGAGPQGLTKDGSGNLYGFSGGGTYGAGTIFNLTHNGSGWHFHSLYTFLGSFEGATDGANPVGLIVGVDGNLYGTTEFGGNSSFCGTVFRVTTSGNETVLYRFHGGDDGCKPTGGVVSDAAGNLYGTTTVGGAYNSGTIFRLRRSGNNYSESVVYSFNGLGHGGDPVAGLTFDSSGNLWGTTCGGLVPVVFELTPSGNGWTYQVISGIGEPLGGCPNSPLVDGGSGVFYGTLNTGGQNGDNVFQVKNGVVSDIALEGRSNAPPAPVTLVKDSSTVLYGIATQTAYCGTIFKLTRQAGTWTSMDIHHFDSNYECTPNANSPWSILEMDNVLYGTASSGGPLGYGAIWKYAP